MIRDFEDFLMEKHAEQYIGTKDCMIDDFDKWVQDLGADEFIEYGNKFFAQIKSELLGRLPKKRKLNDSDATIICNQCGRLTNSNDFVFNDCLNQVKKIIEEMCK